jgi:hypothetical protein
MSAAVQALVGKVREVGERLPKVSDALNAGRGFLFECTMVFWSSWR